MAATNFYSTLAQMMASLVALYGIFAVFRWQVLEQQIGSAHEALKSYIKQNIPRGSSSSGKIHEVEMWLGKDVIPNLRREIYNTKHTDHFIPLCDYYLEITRLEDFKEYLFSMVFWCSFAPFFFLSIAIFTLICSFISFIIFIFLLVLFYWLIRLILRALKGKEPILINNDDTNRPEDRTKFSKAKIESLIIDLLKSKGIGKNPFGKSNPKTFDRWTIFLLKVFYQYKD